MIFDTLLVLGPATVIALLLAAYRRGDEIIESIDTDIASSDIDSSDDSNAEVDGGLRHDRPWH